MPALVVTLFMTLTWLAFKRNTSLNAEILRSSDPFTLKLRYFLISSRCSEGTYLQCIGTYRVHNMRQKPYKESES